jgi:hypothetical protein
MLSRRWDVVLRTFGATHHDSPEENGDGIVNSGDNLQFRKRFNKALTWST